MKIWGGVAGGGQSGRSDGEGGIPAIEPNQRAILADCLRLSVRIAWVGGDCDGVCHESVVRDEGPAGGPGRDRDFPRYRDRG